MKINRTTISVRNLKLKESKDFEDIQAFKHYCNKNNIEYLQEYSKPGFYVSGDYYIMNLDYETILGIRDSKYFKNNKDKIDFIKFEEGYLIIKNKNTKRESYYTSKKGVGHNNYIINKLKFLPDDNYHKCKRIRVFDMVISISKIKYLLNNKIYEFSLGR